MMDKPDLSQLTERFLDDYFAFYPTHASSLGLHEYDGQVPDFSAASLQSRIATLKQYHTLLAAIKPDTLDALALLDYGLLRWRIESELWNWTTYQPHRYNPMFYLRHLMVDDYIKRKYSTRELRTEALIQHLRGLPELLAQAQEHLDSHIPAVLIEATIPLFQGVKEFYTESLDLEFRGSSLPSSLLNRLWQARETANAAITSFCTFLQTLLPKAPREFAIGAHRFADNLRYNELVDLPLERLLEIGEADLLRNQAAIQEVACRMDPTKTVREHMIAQGKHHPAPHRLLEETRELLQKLRAFVIERDLVTIIDREAMCTVAETLPYDRWAFAMIETAGPFEQESTESFYYITLPEPGWSAEQVEAWMSKFGYATMTGISIHEAYPGHYVHSQHIARAPTRMAKVFDSYAHVESWAHYCEQMMLEQGFGDGELSLRLAQLGEALVRNCRYLCSIQMHTQGMTVEEATQMFAEHAYMDPLTASREAQRGTYDPDYLNYTLGKLMLLKLLQDYRAAMGNAFSLKQFHDSYIGYGAPPVPLLRKMLLPHDDGRIL